MCMGLGKGNLEYWVFVLKLRKIIYEINGVFEKVVWKVMRIVFYKLFIWICFLVCN